MYYCILTIYVNFVSFFYIMIIVIMIVMIIGLVNEYPTMHYFGNPRHTQSMIAYVILTGYLWKFQ